MMGRVQKPSKPACNAVPSHIDLRAYIHGATIVLYIRSRLHEL